MKQLHKLPLAWLTVIGLSIGFTACNDDFNEEDLLQAQKDLADANDQANLEALNQAGELVSFQLKVVDTDGQGVEGLEASMAAAATDGTLDNQTVTTDASGRALFDRVAIGGNTVTISGAGIIDAVLLVDFGSISQGRHYQIINGSVIPTPVTETAIVTVLNANTATATVQGTVQIETDLTNATSEVPQDITILADFDDGLSIESSIGIDYFFATNDNALSLGSAAVDNTTGAYSMTVPAGVNFDVIVPNVSATQRIAVARVNNEELDRPEYRDVPANFGPSYNIFSFSNQLYDIPAVVGARVVFEAPADPGQGFTFGSFSRVGRALPFIDINDGNAFTQPFEDFTGAEMVTQFTNLGSGYDATPTVTVNDGGTGTGATAQAYIEVLISSINLTTVGDGYAADADFTIFIDYLDENDVNQGSVASFQVTTNASGEITQAVIDAGLAAAAGGGFDFYSEINDEVNGFELDFPFTAGTDPAGTVTVDGRIHRFFISNSGDNYTDPSFTFSGGGTPAAQAVLEVLQFGTQWSFDVDNSGVTTPYPLLPADIYIEYVEVDDDSRFVDQEFGAENVETNIFGSFLNDLLTVDGAGDVQWLDQTASYQTSFLTHEQPVVIVVENEANIAEGTIFSNDIDSEDGSVFDFSVNDQGSGYTAVFSITIEPSADGAPGTGVVVQAIDGQFLNTGEYDWFGDFQIMSEGSGFLQNLNQTDAERNYSFPGTNNFRLPEGDVRIVDIDYGTGVRGTDFL